jgi:hypothetical protein
MLLFYSAKGAAEDSPAAARRSPDYLLAAPLALTKRPRKYPMRALTKHHSGQTR